MCKEYSERLISAQVVPLKGMYSFSTQDEIVP